MASVPVFAYCRNGGSHEAVVDGSVTPVEFTFTPPGDAPVLLSRMIVLLGDTGSLDTDAYGNGVALATGIEVEAGGLDLLAGEPIKANLDWAGYCHDIVFHDFGGSTTRYFTVRWTFSASGKQVRLDPGEEFVVRINDDLTGLAYHRFMVQGHQTYPT